MTRRQLLAAGAALFAVLGPVLAAITLPRPRVYAAHRTVTRRLAGRWLHRTVVARGVR